MTKRIEKLEVPTDDELFAEVDPSYKRKRSIGSARVLAGESATPVVPAKLPSPMTEKQREAFRELCEKKFALDSELQGLETSIERVKGRIADITRRRGIPVRQQDRVVFCAPYKAQLEQRGAGETLDTEMVTDWARQDMPSLLQIDRVRTLDLEAVHRALQGGELPKHLAAALKAIEQAVLGKEGFIQENRTESLDHEAFERARVAQQIPQYVLDAAVQHDTGHFALTIHVLRGKGRCGSCGLKLPKRRKVAPCKRCGRVEG